MNWTRSSWLAVMVGGLMTAGCEREPTPMPPSPPTPVRDDQADWVDPGRYSACTADTRGDACGELDTFDRSSCDKASLASVPFEGIYTLVYRTDHQPPFASAGVFRVSADGSLDSFRGVKPTDRRVGREGFYLSTTLRTSETVTMRYSLVTCRAEGRRLYGCFITCRNGNAANWGSFMAERWQRREGEAEASGMRLVSETPVAQGLPVDIYVTQGHAYVVSIRDRDVPGGLTVLDVRDPSKPVRGKTISLPTDNYWNGVWAKGNALYVASGDTGVLVFDISNPADPVLLRGVPSGRGALNMHTVFVDGDRLYAMAPSPQPITFIFDISTPTAPVLLGEYAEPAPVGAALTYPHDALAFEGRLYINHWSNGYLIVDVNDPAQPRKLGAFTYGYSTSHANAVMRKGERLIAFEGGESWGAHLRVLDVTDPAKPKRIGEYKLGDNVSIHNMVLKGERLYVAHYQHGVRVLDVSVPESPREVAYYNTFRESDPGRGESFYDGALGIRVPGDGFVYAVDSSRGMLVFPEL